MPCKTYILFNMERNSKLWTCVHELVGLHSIANSKYVLSYSNWNDYGYQTGFGLYIALPENQNGVYNIPIASLSIVEHYPVNREKGRFLPIYGNTNFTTFIMSKESAECMYLTLTYEERMELISKLNIRFNDSYVREQGNYKTSTLRSKTREEFLAMQQEIKEIIYEKNDVSLLVRKHIALSSIKLYP